MSSSTSVAPTGHTQVKPDANGRGRSYYAFWRDAAGRHGRRLGSAHVRDSGRRTARGAVVWRAGDGPKPTPEHLTPKDAQARLAAILAEAPTRLATGSEEMSEHTLRRAVELWLDDRTSTRGLKRSTRMDYEDLFERLYRDLGEETPVGDLYTRDLLGYFTSFEARRVVGERRAEVARQAGERVTKVSFARWTARPADSMPVEVPTKAEAVEIAAQLGGRWKHRAPGVYRVTPPCGQRPRRVGRGEAMRLEVAGYVVERREVERWAICTPAAAQTRNKYRDVLSAVLDFAVRLGWLAENPLDKVVRLSRRADRRRILRRTDFYDPAETRALLCHAPGDFERAFWLCGFHAGLRLPGEAQGLRWGAVDFEVGVIRVYDNWVRNAADGTKTSDSEAVPMTPELRSVLWSLKQRGYRTADDEHVFTRDALGHPASEKELREAFRVAREAAELKPIPMYNTRHSFGTALARAGVPARAIQALMRHTRLSTTEQYLAYAPQPDLAERLTRALAADPVALGMGAAGSETESAVERLLTILEEEIPAKWFFVVQAAIKTAGLAGAGRAPAPRSASLVARSSTGRSASDAPSPAVA